MADVHSRAVRSRNMSAVRGGGNQSTEERFRGLLRLSAITGWRRKTTVYGKPDFVFHAQRVAVFLDGCFWHGCPRGCRNLPATNREFWKEKIEANRRRDRVVNRTLKAAGWSVIRVWEHALRTDPNGAIRRLQAVLQRRSPGRHCPVNVEAERSSPAAQFKAGSTRRQPHLLGPQLKL